MESAVVVAICASFVQRLNTLHRSNALVTIGFRFSAFNCMPLFFVTYLSYKNKLLILIIFEAQFSRYMPLLSAEGQNTYRIAPNAGITPLNSYRSRLPRCVPAPPLTPALPHVPFSHPSPGRVKRSPRRRWMSWEPDFRFLIRISRLDQASPSSLQG